MAILHLMDLDDSRGSFDSTIIKEKLAEVSRAISVPKSSEMELRPSTLDISSAVGPVSHVVQVEPTILDLLAESSPSLSSLRCGPLNLNLSDLQ